jgi:uncharacterized protein (DUF433 family)
MVTLHRTAQEKADLIARYIARDPRHPGLYDSYLSEYGVSVWAIISRFETVNHADIDEAAADYDLPREAVEAALAFYEQHTAAIDARIEAQNAQFS